MPYRSMLYRTLALAVLAVVGVVVAATALRTPETPAPVRSASEGSTVTPASAAPPDTLTRVFYQLQNAFAPEGATLTTERPLDATVRLLRRTGDYVEVTWTEESLLLAERRIQQVQTLFGLWGLHEDRVALMSAKGPRGVSVVRYPSLEAAEAPAP